MKILFLNPDRQEQIPKKVCLSLGCFDGVHLGHQQILKKLKQEAHKKNLSSCLCIFKPHPLRVLKPNLDFKTLYTFQETQKLLKSYSLDYLCVIPFDSNFSKLSAQDFISFLNKKFQSISSLIVGYDFSFGSNREGNFEYLKQASQIYGFDLHQLPAFREGANIVSTSYIKKKLQDAEISKANRLLARPFFIEAFVVSGEGRGKKLGLPTANLSYPKDKFLPKKGVYKVQVEISYEIKKAVMNIGCRPSFKTDSKLSVEVHIPFEKHNLYGKHLKIELLSYIRNEKYFSNSTELKAQIQKDISKALA